MKEEGGREEGRKEGERKGNEARKEGRKERRKGGREQGAKDFYYSTSFFHFFSSQEFYVFVYLLFSFWYVFWFYSCPALAFAFVFCAALCYSFPGSRSLRPCCVAAFLVFVVFSLSLFGFCVSLFLLFVFCVAGRPLAWHCFLLPLCWAAIPVFLVIALLAFVTAPLFAVFRLIHASSCLPFLALCISLFALLAFLDLADVGRATFAGGMPFLL